MEKAFSNGIIESIGYLPHTQLNAIVICQVFQSLAGILRVNYQQLIASFNFYLKYILSIVSMVVA
ncbi:hypothetical protein [Candidatus Paracaedibacter symbiosus]|uniref:hypothetical protein n=1 Tax=Candidatus Paracaedibacter symbiosus TaxID=244582 RepID=UPI001E64E98A|nr:hypothetical protein [Candidatus Paracaedibacter symbiosus]